MMGVGFSLFAQSGKLSEDKRKEFEAQKVAFFTQEMELTPEEATKFWPLYNEMQQKMRVENDKIRNLACRKDKKEASEVTEQQALKIWQPFYRPNRLYGILRKSISRN